MVKTSDRTFDFPHRLPAANFSGLNHASLEKSRAGVPDYRLRVSPVLLFSRHSLWSVSCQTVSSVKVSL